MRIILKHKLLYKGRELKFSMNNHYLNKISKFVIRLLKMFKKNKKGIKKE